MLLKLFGVTLIIAYLIHVFISGHFSPYKKTLPPNSIRLAILARYCFLVVVLSPVIWLILFAEDTKMIDTADQLISNLWECMVVAAPFIVIGCIFYMHKILLGYDKRVRYLDEHTSRMNQTFQESDELPHRIKRKFASGKPVNPLSLTSTRAQPRSEQPGFEDTLETLFQQD